MFLLVPQLPAWPQSQKLYNPRKLLLLPHWYVYDNFSTTTSSLSILCIYLWCILYLCVCIDDLSHENHCFLRSFIGLPTGWVEVGGAAHCAFRETNKFLFLVPSPKFLGRRLLPYEGITRATNGFEKRQ